MSEPPLGCALPLGVFGVGRGRALGFLCALKWGPGAVRRARAPRSAVLLCHGKAVAVCGVPQALEIMPKPVLGTPQKGWEHPTGSICLARCPLRLALPCGVPSCRASGLVWCWMSLWPLCSEKGVSWGCQAQGKGGALGAVPPPR